jgi:hypothetical protein
MSPAAADAGSAPDAEGESCPAQPAPALREKHPFSSSLHAERKRQLQTRPPLRSADLRPRRALQKLDALLVSIEQLGPSLSDLSSPRN